MHIRCRERASVAPVISRLRTMKDIRAVRGRRYILDLIAEGDHEQQDFKYSITDAC